MRLLAWDTSSKSGAFVALEWNPDSREGWGGVRLVSEWALNVDATHSERVLWVIHHLLEAARWKIDEVDLFGVGMGPGSFTGLRIGITTARTLAHSLRKPLIGVSSLAALARPAALWLSNHSKKRAIVVASTDACKGELYALYGAAKSVRDCVAMAEGDFSGLWKRGVVETVLSPEELIRGIKRKQIEQPGKSAWLAVGEGRNRYLDAWKKLDSQHEISAPFLLSHQVQGRYLGLLVWEAYQAGLARKALDVHPRYFRASDAELKLRAGLLNR